MSDFAPPYALGSGMQNWRSGRAWTVTFVITEECNLRCTYCYLSGKNSKSKMTFDTARRAIDVMLKEAGRHECVIIEFIGGEPLLEVGLIDEITEYWKFLLLKLEHKWLGNYRISISTNGTLYGAPAFQKWLCKNMETVSMGITIDGISEMHDLARKKNNGSGSYKDVIRNIPLWLSQYPYASTKVTLSPQTVPRLKDSILHLWGLGILEVAANCAYECDWTSGDVETLETQMMEVADAAIDTGLWRTHNCTLFGDNVGLPLEPEENKNWCGTGKMLAVGPDGTLYPCLRFMPFSLERRRARPCGHVDTGIDEDRIRAFRALTRYAQSPPECLSCSVAAGCWWCQGFNYDSADTETIWQRSVKLCALHKARAAANEYYWQRLEEKEGVCRSWACACAANCSM